MKKWFPFAAMTLAFALSTSAFAMEVPTDTIVQNLNGSQQVIKTYTIAPGADPQQLIEEPFVLEGYRYTFADIVKTDNLAEGTKTHTETVTVETSKDDLDVILEQLAPTIEYDDGCYSGTLSLDHTSLRTEATGYCADCGKPLVRYKQVWGKNSGNKVGYYYLCPTYATLLEQSGCIYKFFKEETLLNALQLEISLEVSQAVDMAALARRLSAGKEGRLGAAAAQLKRLNLKLERLETLKKTSMLDYLGGKLSTEEYERLKENCTEQADSLKAQATELRAMQKQYGETLTEANPWLRAFGRVSPVEPLTSQLTHALIERILIYDNSHIEVVLRFRDEKEKLMVAAKEVGA